MDDTGDIQKQIWTDGDFDQMSFHDCLIHAIGFRDYGHALMLDIDYVFSYAAKGSQGTWVSPATLIFSNISDVRMGDVRIDPNTPWFEIDDLTVADEGGRHRWTIKLSEGAISLLADGYTMFARAEPVLLDGQAFDPGWRGGISFEHPCPPTILSACNIEPDEES